MDWLPRKNSFTNLKDARDFLVEKLFLQAALEGKPYNNEDRKSMYIIGDEPSSTWEIDVDKCAIKDGEEEEPVLVELLRAALKRDKGTEGERRFKDAVDYLWKEEREQGNESWIGLLSALALKKL